jgi:RluA family pseudouridine synthase
MTDQTLTTLTSTIHNNPKGASLLDYLCNRFPYKNRSGWTDAITNGQVVINDKLSLPDQILKLKDSVSYTSQRHEPAVATDIQTIFEDEYIMVVNKPSPLPVHSQGAFIINTLIYILRQRTGNEDLGLGHRLDRETSGVLVLAKDRKLTGKLMARFEEANVEKWYLAVTRGVVDFEEKFVSGWMGDKPNSLIGMRKELVDKKTEGYQESSTRFFLQEHFKNQSLLACELLSGRTNQIRVHLESIGFSIVGDKMYGRSDQEYLDYLEHLEKRGDLGGGGNWDHPRQLLHSWKLSMNHPVTNERINFEAPMPKDMKEFMEKNK